jgi:hypothetical protein
MTGLSRAVIGAIVDRSFSRPNVAQKRTEFVLAAKAVCLGFENKMRLGAEETWEIPTLGGSR